jgi:hypothetical protein
MCLASARLQPKPSYARSARMCPGFAMLPLLHPGWNFHAKDYLGEFFRRITRKLGKPQAITATASIGAPAHEAGGPLVQVQLNLA